MYEVFSQGKRVTTPNGPGEVVYVRMAGPDYSKAQAYSVKLDSKKSNPGYTGTMILASDVKGE
jgi:hypothetical protein